MKKYDTIVVGAGTAGTLAAKTIAEAGLSTLLVDLKTRDHIGNKICGDVIGEYHFKELGIRPPNNGAIENKVKGLKVYSPDEETVFTFASQEFMGFMLNRHLFGQWLLQNALDSGAELLDSTMFMEPIIDKGVVHGIKAKDESGNRITVKSKVVVDASGYFGVVRNKLPLEMGFEGKLANEDVELCYREVRQLEQELDDTNYCKILLNQENTPGGYTWIFPKKDGQVNAGLGFYMHGEYPNPKDIFYKHVVSKPLFKGSSIIKMGGGFIPTRRPIDRLVGNGVVLIGDAASLVNPVNGGGIGPSMASGYLAGQTIIDALEKGEATEENLWSYGSNLMLSYGKKCAGLDVFRRFLVSTDDTDLNYGMRYRLVTEEDLYRAGRGEEFDFKITEIVRRVFRGIKRFHFLKKLSLAVRLMKQVRSHYEDYPTSPELFEVWQVKTLSLFDQVRSSLQN